jgi:DNA-binding GntR family transcriptional regulator
MSAQKYQESKKIKRPGKSTDNIYQQLRDNILLNKLPPKQSIKQDYIAEQFGVSKIPVREALRMLEADGLVEFIPRRGAFVVELTESDILENLEIRIALESHALRLAIPNMTDSDISAARKILVEYEKVTDVERWSELNSHFHQCIYAPCGLSKLIQMIQNIKERTNLFMRLKISQVSGLNRPHLEHLAILSACEDGNSILAVELLRKHIEYTKREVTSYFRTRVSE